MIIPGYTEFEIDLRDALFKRLVILFDEMTAASLSRERVAEIPEEQGLYQLLLKGDVVYVGKTDAEAGLRKRLDRHAWTIQHRRDLLISDVSFRAIRLYVFTPMNLEERLIRHYQPPWNKSGFGSNDPGRRREKTALKKGHFDLIYPIDLDRQIDFDLESVRDVAGLLAAARKVLPYTLRAETSPPKSKTPHPELTSSPIVALPSRRTSAREILTLALRSLPSGWQATALAGRVILYRENEEYAYGELIGRSPNE